MRVYFTRAMDWLQWLCIVWCSIAIVCMTILIFTGVVMRYGFDGRTRVKLRELRGYLDQADPDFLASVATDTRQSR